MGLGLYVLTKWLYKNLRSWSSEYMLRDLIKEWGGFTDVIVISIGLGIDIKDLTNDGIKYVNIPNRKLCKFVCWAHEAYPDLVYVTMDEMRMELSRESHDLPWREQAILWANAYFETEERNYS